MKSLSIITLLAVGVTLSGCILPYHEENARLVAPRPTPPPRELTAFAPPNDDYPTVGGDILKRVPEETHTGPGTAR